MEQALILDNVTIVSDEDYAIEYKIPEGAKKQKGLNIVVEKNSFNSLCSFGCVCALRIQARPCDYHLYDW